MLHPALHYRCKLAEVGARCIAVPVKLWECQALGMSSRPCSTSARNWSASPERWSNLVRTWPPTPGRIRTNPAQLVETRQITSSRFVETNPDFCRVRASLADLRPSLGHWLTRGRPISGGQGRVDLIWGKIHPSSANVGVIFTEVSPMSHIFIGPSKFKMSSISTNVVGLHPNSRGLRCGTMMGRCCAGPTPSGVCSGRRPSRARAARERSARVAPELRQSSAGAARRVFHVAHVGPEAATMGAAPDKTNKRHGPSTCRPRNECRRQA